MLGVLKLCDVELLELVAFWAARSLESFSPRKNSEISVELFGRVHIREAVGIDHRANLVAVRQRELDIGRIEAIGDERIRMAILYRLQRLIVSRVGAVVFLDERQVATFHENVVRLSR